MNTGWKKFLENAGAVFSNDSVEHFGSPERERVVATTGDVITDLSHYGLIAVHGEDAANFMQGQFCNDVRSVDGSHSQINGYCSPKGRLLSLFRIFRIEDTFYLLMPAELLESTIKRMKMFVLISKVKLDDAGNTMIRMGLSGPNAEKNLKDILGKIPENVNEAIHVKGHTVLRIAGPCPRFIIVGDRELIEKTWSALDVHAAPVGVSPWRLLDVIAGIPEIYTGTIESFVPQMVNMQAIDGLSFKKGCYTGQEIVARMQYLGTLKRRMYRAHIRTDKPVKPGDNLYAEGDTSGQGTGKIVSACSSPNDGYDVLAVIQISIAESGIVHLDDQNGPVLELQELPYTIENLDKKK